MAYLVVIDLESKYHEFETHQRHCAMSLSKTLCPLLSTGSTREDRKASQKQTNMSESFQDNS